MRWWNNGGKPPLGKWVVGRKPTTHLPRSGFLPFFHHLIVQNPHGGPPSLGK